MPPKPGRVILLALASRLAVLACMVLSDWAFEDLDSSASLPNKPCAIANSPHSSADGASAANHGLAVWDTVYFERVARCGYETDKLNAFFPLIPAAMRGIGAATGLTGMHGHVMVALALNIAAFCAAAACLHRLGTRVLAPVGSSNHGSEESRRTADLALVLFCFNPASVFYSAAYSETMFAACTWAGILLLPAHHWAGVAALATAAASRSNGILGMWFPLHKLLVAWRRQGRLRPRQAMQAVLSSIAILAPYAAMQVHAYLAHCVAGLGVHHASRPVWCTARLPSVYGYIQREYWDVGLLRFYRDPSRLPMVLMSVPVAWLSIGGCWAYFAADWRRALTLGLYCKAGTLPSGLAAVERILQHWWVLWLGWRHRLLGEGAGAGRKRRQQRPAATARAVQGPSALLSSQEAAPLIYHWALMTAVALLAMHVNVATRFLSACPPLYWHAAEWASRGVWQARMLWLWCLAYIALGCLLFPNFYPWA